MQKIKMSVAIATKPEKTEAVAEARVHCIWLSKSGFTFLKSQLARIIGIAARKRSAEDTSTK